MCVPRPVVQLPAATPAPPCSGVSQTSFNTFFTPNFNIESGPVTSSPFLTPVFINVSQTIYSVAVLIHPQTIATVNYTVRAALYIASTVTNAFTLIGQSAQTLLPGSVIGGQFTEYFFALLTPALVLGNTTVYLSVEVDQVGIQFVYDGVGNTLLLPYTVGSAASASQVLFTAGAGGSNDVSRGILSCAAPGITSLPTANNTCSNTVPILNGPDDFNIDYYYTGVYQLLGALRPLNVTQQIDALAMSFYWDLQTPNTVPVHVTLALYGPPTCGTQGDAQLLAVTPVYTFPPGSLIYTYYGYYGDYYYGEEVEVLLPLTTPLIVPAGTYAVLAEVDSYNLQVLFGPSDAGFTGGLVADAYTFNTYNYSSGNFPNVTYLSSFLPGYDTEAQIIGSTCVGNVALSTFPVCVPKPIVSIPASPLASAPCGASVLYYNTFSNGSYTYEVNPLSSQVFLTPFLVNVTQTIYTVALLIHPQTNGSITYWMRPALYIQGLTPTSYILIAQAAQTIIPGSVLAGQFTEYFFPLATPVTVAANTTVWLNFGGGPAGAGVGVRHRRELRLHPLHRQQ